MKVLFSEARKRIELRKNEIGHITKKLPEKLGILASLQYINIIPYLKKELEKRNKTVLLSSGRLTKYAGQVIGCDVFSALNIKHADAFLLIGSGKFHALQVALETKKPVFIWQPGTEIARIKKEDIKNFENKRKTALIKFLNANEAGILVSIKPGQYKLNEALSLRKKLKKKNFIFLFDTLNLAEIENFSCQSWINTACPNIILDDTRILNIKEIRKISSKP